MDPDQRLSRSGLWISQFTQFDAVDPTKLLCKRYSHLPLVNVSARGRLWTRYRSKQTFVCRMT